ncbi:LysR family transcriptional regulator [Citricoccus sp. NPDC079358]|uniref:LysR family transcriptional regulator n=1 Tax=Citricoccus sp. NPDC079358 TaxID=3154653 RepID=UPI00345080DB
MTMNLEQLRGFMEVARVGHFTRAAETLHVTQPSLSRQIATLEHDLGSELFHRARGHITLTAAGETLLPLARRMLADAETVRREMAELAGLQRGRVRLGATPSLCVGIVADAVAAFHAAHPGIELHLTERGSRGLIDELSSGALDLALVITSDAHPGTAPSLTRSRLLTEELVVVGGGDAPFGGRTSVTLKDLAGMPQIVFPSSYDLRGTLDEAFRAVGLTPRVVLEGAEMDAVLRFVELGMGVALVPAMVLVDRPGLSSVRLREPRLSRTISLARRQDVQPTRAAAAMHRMILRTADALAAGDRGLGGLVSRAG